jgi:hypothetical protein
MKYRRLILILAVELMLMPFVLWADDDAPPMGHRRGPMSDEQIQEVLEFVKTHWPEYHGRLLEVREENPRRFRMMIRAAAHRMHRFESMSEEEQQAHIRESKLKIEIYRLSREYRLAEEDQKPALRKKLHQTVAEAFDVEQKVREYGLQRLESQLRQLRKDLKQRSERREEIIDKRVESIIQGTPLRGKHHGRPGHDKDGPPPPDRRADDDA